MKVLSVAQKLLIAFAVCAICVGPALAAEYHPDDVAAVNAMIDTNGLDATRGAPERWGFIVWNEESPRRVRRINVSAMGLRGTLDTSGLASMEELICGLNELTAVDVSRNAALKVLHCNENRLTALDVTNNPRLNWLWCYGNELTELDVTRNPKLISLHCAANRLTSLDISRCPELQSVNATGNDIKTLDKSRNKKLTTLWWDGMK